MNYNLVNDVTNRVMEKLSSDAALPNNSVQSNELSRFLQPVLSGINDASESVNQNPSFLTRLTKSIKPFVYDQIATKPIAVLGGIAGQELGGHPVPTALLAYLAARYLTYNKVYNMTKDNFINASALK